ncbi:penicillin acylase II [Fictibacillus macauensis ZFHKF-1]|uniref:Penicillin acylase II n=1 Tax=Fictibacillus macauensis ZFHKF-1 TaxID=1196324 RepID=I8UFS9_9BACL|nr:penicillin acylase family protein [Fictibacillus macauensis]EIT85750.1 penicillin acylase II [Fictibacillus macauensis ZFHKF-1]
MAKVVTDYKKTPSRKWWKITIILLASLVMLLGIGSSVAYWKVNKSKPVISGEVVIDGLDYKVSAIRDTKGVPHIKAKSTKDLYMVQGYVTAQDRMFQMDLSRRQASGELSEVIGKKTIDKDRYFRTLGLRRAAQASYKHYSTQAKQALQWYADGVNAYLKEAKGNHALPIEFILAGYEPSAWTPIDSLTIGKYMAFDLGGHWEGQAFRYYLLQHFSKEQAFDLFPSYPTGAPDVIEAAQQSNIDVTKSMAKAVIPHRFNGSNNWVVSGEKTASGKPFLADDPHLGLATPSIWYETHLQDDTQNVRGVVFAGVPGVILGSNDHIAWGVTNVGPDVQDLYIEKRNPKNKHEFLYKGKWERATTVSEPIKVKGESTIPYEVTITRHGPVMSEFAQHSSSDKVLAMKWTALQPSAELQGVLQYNKATNWNEFKAALTYFHTPAQNFVFASTDGTIAYRANGLIPIRKQPYTSLPVPGWNDRYEWKGYIPWEKLPTVVNPKEGFIATANNQVIGKEYPYHLTDTWAQPYREARIKEVLRSKKQFSLADMKSLQTDHHNLQAREMLPILVPLLKKSSLTSQEKKAIALLEKWNQKDDAHLAAPLLFNLWMEDLPRVLFAKKINKKVLRMFDGQAQVTDQLIRRAAKGKPGPWMKEAGGLQRVAEKSFKHTVAAIEKMQGTDLDKWQWGEYHVARFTHPLAAIKPLNLFFNPKPYAVGGSRVTVGAAGWDEETGSVDHGAAWRTVIDMAKPNQSDNVVAPGQSGHVLSEWYDDQISDWVDGNYHRTYTDERAFKKGTTLTLVPSK